MAKKKFNWTEPKTAEASTQVSIRCLWYTRLIIGPNQTQSGRRYEFEPGQVRHDIDAQDLPGLLAMVKNQSECCGGIRPQPLKYFEEI